MYKTNINTYLEEFKQRKLQEELKLNEKQRQIKAQERKRRQQHEQHLRDLEKQAQEALKEEIEPLPRTILIYHTRYIERFTDDTEVYNTREELKEAEKRNEGRIRWDLFDKLIQLTKEQIETKKKNISI